MFSKLKEYFKKNYKITLSSKIDNEEEIYHGYIVGLTHNFICLWLVVDWHHDGFLIMPVKYISDIKYSKYEKTYHHILNLEGCLIDLVMPNWLKIKSYKSVFKTLEANSNNVTIESRLPSIDEFAIGKISKITDKKLYIKGYDATAKWQDGIYKIPFKEITAIKFGDEYSSVLRKYVL